MDTASARFETALALAPGHPEASRGLARAGKRNAIIEHMQRGRVAVEPVEVAHQQLYAAMYVVLEQVPIEALVVVPLRLLRELAAHEQQLLAGMAPHEPEISA